MRTILIALVALAPLGAAAQTPGDIARQVWPQGAPASQNVATVEAADLRGGFTPADLARLAASGVVAHNTAPSGEPVRLSGFTVADLVRLRGDAAPASTLFQSSSTYRIVAR